MPCRAEPRLAAAPRCAACACTFLFLHRGLPWLVGVRGPDPFAALVLVSIRVLPS